MFPKLIPGGCLWLSLMISSATAGTVFYTPSTSYKQASDSPFAAMSFSAFTLDNFESNSITAGVTASAGNTSTNSGFSGPIVDSVDADDGAVDGKCDKSASSGTCVSFFNSNGAQGVTWTFDTSAFGSLPTAAGIVWTDGFGTVTFQAFGPGMVLLGTKTNADGGWVPGPSFSDQDVNEDHFFGVSDPNGILAISLTNSSGGIEMDHLQYGVMSTSGAAVPEPGAIVLMATGLCGIYLARRRFTRSAALR
jgi:hypothetical protein